MLGDHLQTEMMLQVSQVEGPLLHPEIYNGGLLKHPKGILLYGPPGTGKTMMAQVGRTCVQLMGPLN